MKSIYSNWDDALQQALRQFAGLKELFNNFLLQLNGDVNRALNALRRLQQLGYIDPDIDLDEFERKLLEEAIIEVRPEGKALTRKGERELRRNALEKVFGALRKTGRGNHPVPQEGGGSDEKLPEKREYRFGDSAENIDFTASLFNSITRAANLDLNLAERDLEVHETEKTTSCATALLLDVSHSMILYGEDRITPAKQVALAIAELITTKYP
ncbi:MAG TPA: hypothetical protein VLB27_06075, partial [candidate division Zixibacteria bacterium]|nr:hypothetical protein [candidate division Zixibacteria bacterium]